MNRHNNHGFTIVELLIVIVVIATLAAITVVSYGNISTRAIDSTIQADLRDASVKMNRHQIEKGIWPQTWQEAVPPGQFGGTAAVEHGIRVAKRANYSHIEMCGYGRPANSPSYFGPANSVGLLIVGTHVRTGKIFAVTTESNSPRDVSSFYDPAVSTNKCVAAATAFDVKSGFLWNLYPYVGSNS